MSLQPISDIETDVLVVGAGGSGLAAAVSAREVGAKVVVIEKNADIGGTTRLSIGSFTSTGTPHQRRLGIADSPDEHLEDMALFAGQKLKYDNAELRRVLADNAPETMRWLMSLGVTFYGPMPEPPHRKPRMHNVLPNSRAYIWALRRRCSVLGVEIRTSMRAEAFIRNEGRVVGVEASSDGRQCRFLARRGVVLTSGDYSGGADLKRRFAPDQTDIDAINPTNTGDGQLMCERIGCEIVNGPFVTGPKLRFVVPPTESLILRLPPWRWLTATMAFALEYGPSWLLRPIILSFVTTFLSPEAMMFREGAIMINRNGERFADETNNPEAFVAKQPSKDAFIVFDAALARKFSKWPFFVSTAPGVAYAYVPDYRRTRPDLYYEGASVAELARKINVPEEALERAIDGYNADPRRVDSRASVAELPLCALGPVKAWTILTDGGPRVDNEHRVIDKDGHPIAGLFAAGASGQGGLLLLGHGHHIAWAFTSGRRAGRNAALRVSA